VPRAIFQLGQQLDSAFATQALSQLLYTDFKATATATTLTFVTERMLTPLQGRRVGAETLVVAMLGAPSQEGLAAVQEAGAGLRQLGARVLAVGPASNIVGLEDEMLAVASDPSNNYALETLETLALNASYLQELFLRPFVCTQASQVPSSTIAVPASTSSFIAPASSFPVSSVSQLSSGMFTATPSPTKSFSSFHEAPSIIASPSSFVALSSFLSTAPSSSVASTFLAAPSPTPSPTPWPTPNYCPTFVTYDVVFVISMSGKTGPDVFQRFINLAASIIHEFPIANSDSR
jgi:hypothetical protein